MYCVDHTKFTLEVELSLPKIHYDLFNFDNFLLSQQVKFKETMECTADSCCLAPLIPILPGTDIPSPPSIIDPSLLDHSRSTLPDSPLSLEEEENPTSQFPCNTADC